MPFWNNHNKEVNYHARLEHKLCVAKETPEPTFDLAGCNLGEVPPGVFSMCRVFLKEVLLLQNNNLQSLHNGGTLKDLAHLRMLNLSNNKISVLSEDFGNLVSLEVLNLEDNKLKKLPKSFVLLRKLSSLNLKGNKLQEFPVELCSLPSLRNLNICNNKLKLIPEKFCDLVCLENLELDSHCFTYPPPGICSQGIESIMMFLCKEYGRLYVPSLSLSSSEHTISVEESNIFPSDAKLKSESELPASFDLYQRTKDQRRKELILMEEAMKESQEIQTQFSTNALLKRQKLLVDVTQEQERLEEEILQIQNKKDKERQALLSILSNIEDHSAKLIDQLINLNQRCKNFELLEVMERERVEAEEIYFEKQEELEEVKKREILEAMKDMLQAEENQRKYEAGKFALAKEVLSSDSERDRKLVDIIRGHEQDQQNLINKLLEEEIYQKEAFEALQIQRDKRHIEISYQIKLIEKELSKLTLAELKKKDLKANFEINILADRRTALAQLLSELLEAKENREKELQKRLHQMEQKRLDEMKDFWLIQYQKLLDRKPQGIVDSEITMDPFVHAIIVEAGAIDFIPIFAAKFISLSKLLSMSIDDFRKLGILDTSVCKAIHRNCRDYFELLKQTNETGTCISVAERQAPEVPSPSAPPEEENAIGEREDANSPLPSAPFLSPNSELKLWCQNECVVCMDMQSDTVFLPCGHVCCCKNCSKNLSSCPMCRTDIFTQLTVIFS